MSHKQERLLQTELRIASERSSAEGFHQAQPEQTGCDIHPRRFRLRTAGDDCTAKSVCLEGTVRLLPEDILPAI